MADTLNLSNKKISAKSFLGGDKVEKYRQELIAEGRIPGTKLNATPEERRQAFNLYRQNKIDFKNFVEKVLQKKNSVAYAGISKPVGGVKKLTGAGALVKASPKDLKLFKEQQIEKPKGSFAIVKSLNSILATLNNQLKFDKKKSDDDKKEEERSKRSKRESALEAVKKVSSKIIDKVIAPFKSIMDRIWNFIFYTLLGRAFTKLMDWLGDPKNADKVKTLGRFLKDWWPALLGLYFMPFKGFMLKTLGQIAAFSFKNPLITISAIGYAARQREKERIKPYVEKDLKSTEQTLKDEKAPWYQKLGAYFAKEQLTGPRGPSDPLTMPVPGAMYASGGLINSNTGLRITGAGADTQLTALQPGEIVMNRATVKAIGAEKLLALNARYGGVSANKPRFANNVQFAQNGGIIGSLGRFLPGTGTVIAPRGRQWEGQGTTVQKLLGITIPGSERTTTYSQEDINRYNQLNKLRQLMSGQALYNGAYGRYMARMTQTQPTQGTFVQDAFRNFGRNVQTIKGTAKRQEEIMRRMGYEPSGYVNLSGQPIQGRQGGGMIPQGPFTPLPSPGYIRPQGSFIPRPMLRLPGPMPGSTVPFGYDPFKGLKGGGMVKENTGMNVLGGTADRQLTALQPGEYVLPADTVSKLGVSLIDKLVAMTDNNSFAAKLGKRSSRYMPGPLSRSNRGGMVSLPPITQSSGGGMASPAAGTSIPSFSAVSPHGATERSVNASIYGIVG